MLWIRTPDAKFGATTFSTTTFSITTLIILTHTIMGLFATFSIIDTHHSGLICDTQYKQHSEYQFLVSLCWTSLTFFVGNLRLVIDLNVAQRQTAEQMRILGMTSLTTFLTSLINRTFVSHVRSFSNGQFYCQCYLPLAATFCLSLSLCLSLSVSLLSRSLSPFLLLI